MKVIFYLLADMRLEKRKINFDLINGTILFLLGQFCFFSSSPLNLWHLGELFSEKNLKGQPGDQLRKRLWICRAFSKILILIDAISTLVKLARSPNVRHIFQDFRFEPIYLHGEKATKLPTNIEIWKERFAAMHILGSLPGHARADRKNLEACIQQAFNSSVPALIHAEIKVLIYLHVENLRGSAINHIGISKLCCPGCYEFVRSIDNPPVLVNGRHNQWYPWPFSPKTDFPSL